MGLLANVFAPSQQDDPEAQLSLIGVLTPPVAILAPPADGQLPVAIPVSPAIATAPPSPAVASPPAARPHPHPHPHQEKTMGSYSALAVANVSDRDALAAVKALDMPPSQRPKLWRERWDNSAALQREFRDPDSYVAYMEGHAEGRLRMIGLPV